MSTSELARLPDVGRLLSSGGYQVAKNELAGTPVLLAETPYALVACAEFTDWDKLDEQVSDVQGALTQFASSGPSARNWDLYVVALVLSPAHETASRALAESIEADTRYARKFVRIAIGQDELDRALRPLMPLRPPADLTIRDPLDELREELETLNVTHELANVAVDSFRRHDRVEVP
jgi:hypothetical protein